MDALLVLLILILIGVEIKNKTLRKEQQKLIIELIKSNDEVIREYKNFESYVEEYKKVRDEIKSLTK